MINNFHMPPMGYGPGSQPASADGQELEYMPLPNDMRVFQAHLPEIDAEQATTLAPALTLLANVAKACAGHRETGDQTFSLAALDQANRALIDETFGTGEVAAEIRDPHSGEPTIKAQESVFAGVWTVKGDGEDRIDIAPMPAVIRERAFHSSAPAIGPLTPVLPGVVNAPPLVTELLDKSSAWTPETEVHVINLSLLPHTPEDLTHLDMALGEGAAAITSKGYGDCRIRATALHNVWKVQFFNSMDVMILDSFEVTGIPEVALAAAEDFEDSGERLREILETIK
ncbi:MAG: hydrogenase expression/formation protein [Rhodospirillaceae bacterium]